MSVPPGPISQDFWIICIGSSAGGLEALTSFVSELPADPKAVFIIAQHLAPHAKSMMVELLARQTKLPVIQLQDRFELKPGVICVIPPNFDASFEGNLIHLTKAGEETRPKPSVDTLFKSLAENHGPRGVGIILSGTGSDGSEGVRAIKENGGIILSQDNESAKYDGMPRSAQDGTPMDEVLPASEIGKRLFSILADHSQPAPSAGDLQNSPYLKKILVLLRDKGNNNFLEYKTPTIARRVEKRLASLKLSSHEEYLNLLQNDSGEVEALAQELLVSVTSFFRDADAFAALEMQLKPILEEKSNSHSEMRVWVAGCATGEEAYTYAILIFELARKLKIECPPLKIFATDLDAQAIIHARLGVYTAADLSHLTSDQKSYFFEKNEKFFEVKKPLREAIVFARQNLIQNPPFVKLDLVSCRNVMIYFDNSLQKKVFEIFQYALKPNGLLFLGKSESAPSNLFDAVDRKAKIFYKLDLIPQRIPGLVATRRHPVPPATPTQALRSGLDPNALTSSVPEQLIREYKLTGVVVDDEGVIFHTIGDISNFLKMPTGIPDFRLTNLVPKAVASELAVLIRKCRKDGQVHVSRTYPSLGEKPKDFRFILRPLVQPATAKKSLYIVSFDAKRPLRKKVYTGKNSGVMETADRVIELERELASSKEHLQTLVEELEISNEEMQSINEELSSTNEEMQSSNEELETTNEELQSTNEELITVNEELNTKSSELKLLNLALENIQNSIGSPLLVVDSSARVVSFNSEANKIFTINLSDIGREISDVSCQCEIVDFDEKLRIAINTGTVTDTYCENNSMLYQVRIHPNRDEKNRITGAIVLFFNNTEIIRTQEKLRASDSNIRAIIDGSPALISLKDLMGRYLVVNRAFQQVYGVTEEQMLGRTDREIFPDSFANQMRDYDLEVLLKKNNTEHQETIVHNGQNFIFYSTRFPLQQTADGSPQVVGTVSLDITAQIKAQDQLRDSEARYRAIVEDQAVLVCRYLPDGSLTFTNSAFCAFFGGSPESNLKRILQSFIDVEDRPKVLRELKMLNQEHSITQYETKVVANYLGVARYVRWIHRAIFNEQGTIAELQAVGFDVTELHHQTSYLLQKENLFTHVLEHTSDYLTVYRVEGEDFILESFNPSAGKNRNQGHHRLVGRNLSQLSDSNDVGHVLDKYRECARGDKVVTFEEEIDSPRGTIYLLTTLVPILNQNYHTEKIAALGRDITHLKRVEHALREQKRSSDEANQAKSDFLTAMSHELRTPLGVISGMTQLLGRDPLTAAQVKYVSTIQQSSKSLLALIEDVLDISKIEAGKLTLEERPFKVSELLSQVHQTFEIQARQKGLEFRAQFPQAADVLVKGDQNRLRQILINLLGNAIKFTEKGSITLVVELTAGRNGGYARLDFAVTDTGIGISPDSSHRLFNRFSQADSGIARKFGGTGLGLAISKQLVELMDGQIGFTSAPGKGSTFWFNVDLPTLNPTALPANPEQGHEKIDLSQLTLLAIDDNIDSLELLEIYLQERVKKIYTAQSGQEGIKILENQAIDLVVMDIQMPNLDGMGATKIIRKLEAPKSSVPVIAVTANAMAGDRERFLASGMDDYVSKPIDFAKLFEVLSHWSQKRHDES